MSKNITALVDVHIYSWRSTLPCLTESSLSNSFVQPFHEVDVSHAAPQGPSP